MAADLKLSQLIQRTPDGTEFFEVIISPFTTGTNRKVLLSDLLALAGGAVTSVNGLTGAVTGIGEIADRIDQNNSATTSAQLAATISDETGTGALVFASGPALAGTPTAPTAAPGTNSTQIATTEFATQQSIGSLLYMYNNFY